MNTKSNPMTVGNDGLGPTGTIQGAAPTRPTSDTESASRRTGRRRRARSLGAVVACVAALVATLGPAKPVSAATYGEACFTHAIGTYGVWNLTFPARGVEVKLYWHDGAKWVYAGRGFDRITDSKGCTPYNLSRLPSFNHHGSVTSVSHWTNFSGHHVMFGVYDITYERSYVGFTNGYLRAGNGSGSLHGTVYCGGRLCP